MLSDVVSTKANKDLRMDYEVSFSEREMAPLEPQNNFGQVAFGQDNSKILENSKSPMNGTKVIEDSKDKTVKILESDKLVQQMSLLQCVSENLVQLSSNLTELELSNNNFSELPDLFKSVRNLKRLYIHDTLLSELPESFGELKNLHDLNLSYNQLRKLPETIGDLKHLAVLNLSHNELMKLPSSCAKLQLLKELDLSNNKFLRLPKCLANGMETLRVLNISENVNVRVNVIPNSKYLEKFFAKNNKHSGTFPDWILCSKFFNMKEFNFDNTYFDVYTFNGKDGNLYYTSLSMASSNLSNSYLQMMLENMISLKVINVGNDEGIQCREIGNVFNCIPIQTFRNPKLITELNFKKTGLASIPTTINTLCNLKKLDLSLNNISWLPDEFCELQNLEILKISNSGMIMLPENIGNLQSLQEIHAENNCLEKIPKSIKNLKRLRLIDLYNNKLHEQPEVLFKIGTLESLDLELNYFATTDLKVATNSYLALRENLKEKKVGDARIVGVKDEESGESNSDNDIHWASSQWSSSSSCGEDNFYVSASSDENWDTITDTDEEYEPNALETNYNERSKDYLAANFTPLGFCPADLHSTEIRKEVASMRVYGSMPYYRIEEGQFDDA